MRQGTALKIEDAGVEPDLSYASYFEDPVKRRFIRTVEKLSGQPKIKALYDYYREHLATDVPFFEAAMRLLDLDVHFSASQHTKIPPTGPLVIVANHPFGVLDGLVIAWITSLRRTDFKILTNSALDGIPEAKPWLLPVDFSGTREAIAANIQMRKDAMVHLQDGGCVIVFPGGGVATTPRLLDKTAVDDAWKPFTAKLITHSDASVTPVYFEGQNSRLYQMASHVSLELRLALVFREVKRRMGKPVPVAIGDTLSQADLVHAGKRQHLMDFLREKTYQMADPKTQERLRKAGIKFQKKKPLAYR